MNEQILQPDRADLETSSSRLSEQCGVEVAEDRGGPGATESLLRAHGETVGELVAAAAGPTVDEPRPRSASTGDCVMSRPAVEDDDLFEQGAPLADGVRGEHDRARHLGGVGEQRVVEHWP